MLEEFLFTFPVPGPSRPLTFCTLPKMHPTNPLSIMELVDFHGTSSTDFFGNPAGWIQEEQSLLPVGGYALPIDFRWDECR